MWLSLPTRPIFPTRRRLNIWKSLWWRRRSWSRQSSSAQSWICARNAGESMTEWNILRRPGLCCGIICRWMRLSMISLMPWNHVPEAMRPLTMRWMTMCSPILWSWTSWSIKKKWMRCLSSSMQIRLTSVGARCVRS